MNRSDLFVLDILDEEDARYREIFEAYRARMMQQSAGERLIANYSKEKLNLDDQLSMFVVMSKHSEDIFGFCSIYRPPHWPVGVVRFGNRIWIDRQSRQIVNSDTLGDPFAAIKTIVSLMIGVHLNAAKKHDLKVGIFTREVRGHTRNPFSALLNFEELKQLGFTEDPYGYYQTVPNGWSQSCWQRILFVEAFPGARRFLSSIPRITPDVYASRFLNIDKFRELENVH